MKQIQCESCSTIYDYKKTYIDEKKKKEELKFLRGLINKIAGMEDEVEGLGKTIKNLKKQHKKLRWYDVKGKSLNEELQDDLYWERKEKKFDVKLGEIEYESLLKHGNRCYYTKCPTCNNKNYFHKHAK